ncbi:MAG: MerR family transcriptional regulator [Lachnoclostridium sp.]|nr:MerR family transcriptional regulator [Lachnoclostridium sp.]
MYYTIKQVAKMHGLTEHTLRYYTDLNLIPCERDGANRRVFNDESLNWLQGVKCLRGCGVSIEDIKLYCDMCREGDGALQKRYEFMLYQRELAHQRLREAQEVADYMDHKVAHYEDIISGKINDDTNPTTSKLSQCD